MKMLRKYMHNTVFRYELNAMTRRTFGFDFENWMQNGFRAEEYIPYSFEEKGRIVANVSVNWMFFNKNGEEQLCFQLGTVMEDKAYRSRGLIWQLMERILERYDGIETVVLLSKGEIDSKKVRVEFSLEDMDMSEFQDGATYPQIKEYVLEHTGLKVSNLYISQIKRKCGLEVGKNYNLPKSEDSRQPMCPPEKEKAIREAFKYFGMI